jgi:hypothetical protein
MSFRLTVQLPGSRTLRGYSECAQASEAFTVCRRLAGTRVRVVEILDLRGGDRKAITSAELEAIAQSERHRRHRAARKNGGIGGP